MQRLRFKLPPPNYLITFEAAARHLSFTRAAEELNVTRVAVSQQIKALESYLGVLLFLRLHRTLRLTRAGERYFETVSFALERILKGTNEIRREDSKNTITITSSAGFSSLWLLPKIGQFRQEHPEIEMRFLVSDTDLNLTNEGVDVAIRYGAVEAVGLDLTFLVQEYIFPTAAKVFAEKLPPINHPAELLALPLIHLEGKYDIQTTWLHWFKEQGVKVDKLPRGITVNTYNNVVQTALDGQGVALIGPPLMQRYLNDGSLVRIIDAPPIKRRAFFLAVPKEHEPSHATKLFNAWIIEQFSKREGQ
ncbi:LysR substrate-binding domain-containing protein [Limibacillus sp. MBR-115]|jgi:LysR family glycine cleavage system transcriptional activator|uniref:LysR substrate-binding domain-containing protein n=1 Tax=Limibacillus sp. MBR-115 TaxID=3156465 RepID=UPI003390D062